MKIQDAIQQTEKLVPNQFDENVFMRWLSGLDGKIYNELMVGLEDCPEEAPGTYADTDTELLVPYPYEDLYISYLSAMVYRQNADYERYSNEMIVFNNAYSEYAAMYGRTYRSTDTASMVWDETTDLTNEL